MKIKFYGTDWCGDCKRSKAFLNKEGVSYVYINIDEDSKAAEEVERLNNGNQSIPTIVLPNGKVLVEPSDRELKKALRGYERGR